MPDFNLEQLVRPNVLALKPYSSARDEFKGHASVFLDANENGFGSPLPQDYSRYPDPLQQKLKEKIALIKGVQPNQIFLGNGSDEPIDLLIRAFCEPGQDAVLTLPPTYGMYSVAAGINNVRVDEVPLDAGFQPDVPAILAAVKPEHKLLFICSPNNPTANLMPADAVQALLAAFPGIVVVDEAYIDFAPDASLLPQLTSHPNLVVLQTFSKAWGMAGIRLGMAFASPQLLAILNKIKSPYNISQLTQQTAWTALDNLTMMQAKLDLILAERDRLMQLLPGLPQVVQVFPSDSNFILVRFENAAAMYKHLTSKGIVVRDRSTQYGCASTLRLTVGSDKENDALIEGILSFV